MILIRCLSWFKLLYFVYSDEQDDDDPDKSKVKQTNAAIFADECREYLRQIYEMNKDCFCLLFPVLKFCSPNMDVPVDAFFTDVVPVPPATVRMVSSSPRLDIVLMIE